MVSECNFSFKHYYEILNYAKENYSIGLVRDFPKLKKKEKFIILRHDVDISLEHALNMARVEYEHDLQSTYFILFHGADYNPLSEANVSKIEKIYKLGHEIGLHYDSAFSKSRVQLMKQIKLESKLLGNIIDEKITSIAQHNVSVGPRLNARSSKNFLDAMNSDILNSTTYISDSVQNWRNGCMCKHIGSENKLSILTHPIWWSFSHKLRNKILKQNEKLETVNLRKRIKQTKNVQEKYLKDIRNGRIV